MKTKFTSFIHAIACPVLLWAMSLTLGAATNTVTSTADNGPGSLRAALASAQDGDTINFTVTGMIGLTSGPLSVSRGVTIAGPGAGALAVSGNHSFRVFEATGTNATLSGVTITAGQTTGDGAGIYAANSTALTLSDCVVTNNSASRGGGIFNNSGVMLTIRNCTIAGNTAERGGGIYNFATLTIETSTIRGNIAISEGGAIYSDGSWGNVAVFISRSACVGNFADRGGGIYNNGAPNVFPTPIVTATVEINASSIASNSATNTGGGIYNDSGSGSTAILTITDSTLASNTAGSAGGINNHSSGAGPATVTINNSTLSGNLANSGIWNWGTFGGTAILKIHASTINDNARMYGCNIDNYCSSATARVELGDTILNASADNTYNINNSFGTVLSRGYNLSSDNAAGFLTMPGDQINVNPHLGPLQDNGGPTPTHALLAGSPAIDKGKTNAIPELARATDQRGLSRSVDLPGSPNTADGSDIGAFELQRNLPVTSLADSGPGTMREAIGLAAEGQVIDATGVRGTITLTSGRLLVPTSLMILGPGAGNLTVNGNNASRVFEVTGPNVMLHGLSIVGGQDAEGGAGIKAGGSSGSVLTVSACVISNNSTPMKGGGIYVSTGVITTISNSTIAGNVAAGGASGWLGGGMFNAGGQVTIVNSTLNNNFAGYGGAIYNHGRYAGGATLKILNSTLSTNSASGESGAIANDGAWGGSSAVLKINGCTFSGNTGATAGGIFNDAWQSGSAPLEVGSTIFQSGTSGTNLINREGAVTSAGYNLSSDGGGGLLNKPTDLNNTDPMLGRLQDNGGPTCTHALLAGSPAIDKGKRDAVTSLPSSTDQRGVARPFNFFDLGDATGGDGSDIGAFELNRPTLSLQVLGNEAVLAWPYCSVQFTAKFTANVAAADSWATVPGTPVLSQMQYRLTNAPATGKRFFRLEGN